MPLILWAPTGDVYDTRWVSHDSIYALGIDGELANDSFQAGARLIPTSTYRVWHQLRIGDATQKLDDAIRSMIQTLFHHKYQILSVFKKTHPDIQPIINLHGVGTSPYRGPHDSVARAQEYHGGMIGECLNPMFEHRQIPLLYELIPTIEEACVIAHLCRQNNWKVVISLYTKRNTEWHLCIQNVQGRLIPLEEWLSQIEDAADKENCWYAFNCFDPRLTSDLIKLLKSSHLWERVRGIYPNLADAENDPSFTTVWTPETESTLVGWDPPEEDMPAFIWACCGSTPSHIRSLHALLHDR